MYSVILFVILFFVECSTLQLAYYWWWIGYNNGTWGSTCSTFGQGIVTFDWRAQPNCIHQLLHNSILILAFGSIIEAFTGEHLQEWEHKNCTVQRQAAELEAKLVMKDADNSELSLRLGRNGTLPPEASQSREIAIIFETWMSVWRRHFTSARIRIAH